MEQQSINKLKIFLNSRLELTKEARTAKNFDMSGIINKFDYNDDELFYGLQIYSDLVFRIEKINEKKEPKGKLIFYIEEDGATIDSEIVIKNLEGLYEKLIYNVYQVSSEKNDRKRKVQYKNILKGLRIIADILKEKELPEESLAGNLSAIASLNNVCTGGWVEAITKLIATYQEDIQKKLSIEKANESNELKKRLNLLVEESIQIVTEKVKSDCLNGTKVSEAPHYRLFYTKYFNDKYGLNLTEIMKFNDSLEYIYRKAEDKIANYLEDNDLEDMIVDHIIKTYENILNNSNEGSKAREELLDYWVKPYYTQKYEKELDNWATSYKKSKGKYLKKDINKVLKDSINEDELIKRVEDIEKNFIYDCNSDFISNYIEYYKNKEERRLVIDDITSDEDYKEREYFRLEEKNRNKIKEKLKDWQENKDEVANSVKDIILGSVNVEQMKSDYSVLFLQEFVYDDNYRVKEMVIKEVLKDTGYLREKYDKKINYNRLQKAYLSCAEYNLDKKCLEITKDFVKKDRKFADKILPFLRENIDNIPNVIDILNCLAENGIDINKEDKNKLSLLNFAAVNGHIDVVKYLVENGADVNEKGNNGYTALCFAAAYGHIDVIKYLIEHGADIKAKDVYGYTALFFAAGYGHTNVVKYLIEKGADVSEKDNNGKALLYWLVEDLDYSEYEVEHMVRFLIKNGANIENFEIRVEKGQEDISKIYDIINKLLKQEKNVGLDIIRKRIDKIYVIHTKEGYSIDIKRYNYAGHIHYVYKKKEEIGDYFEIKYDFMGRITYNSRMLLFLKLLLRIMYEGYLSVRDKYRNVMMKKCDYKERINFNKEEKKQVSEENKDKEKDLERTKQNNILEIENVKPKNTNIEIRI